MKRNPFLRVKLKSLAEEAKIIRTEEQRTYRFGDPVEKEVRNDLNGSSKTVKVRPVIGHDIATHNILATHRRGAVRRETRATLIAYQFLRGIPFEAFEKKPEKPTNKINWSSVERMVKKYGGDILALRKWASRDEHKRKAA